MTDSRYSDLCWVDIIYVYSTICIPGTCPAPSEKKPKEPRVEEKAEEQVGILCTVSYEQ